MADTINYSNDGGSYTILSDEARLQRMDALITKIEDVGHAYSAEGAIAYTQSDLEKLNEQRDRYEERCLLSRGVLGCNVVET